MLQINLFHSLQSESIYFLFTYISIISLHYPVGKGALIHLLQVEMRALQFSESEVKIPRLYSIPYRPER
jgi:hypothetical protein